MNLPKPLAGREVIKKLKEIGLISKDCLVRDFCISGSFDDVVEIKVTEMASDKNSLTPKHNVGRNNMVEIPDVPVPNGPITKDK